VRKSCSRSWVSQIICRYVNWGHDLLPRRARAYGGIHSLASKTGLRKKNYNKNKRQRKTVERAKNYFEVRPSSLPLYRLVVAGRAGTRADDAQRWSKKEGAIITHPC